MSKESISIAVELVGGQSALADAIRAFVPACKVKQAHVWQWLNLSKEPVPPAEYVIAIAQAANWRITPYELRPDIYPHPLDGMPRTEQQGAA
jgi:DNA-binding transcriptional regulator YdaS (Cro superfamily)